MVSNLFKSLLVFSVLTFSQFASAAIVNMGTLPVAGGLFNTSGSAGNGRTEVFSLTVTSTSTLGVNLDTFGPSVLGAVLTDPSFGFIGNFLSNQTSPTVFTLAAGNYFLTVSGGTSTTGYFLNGYLNAAPVAEPESFAMFLAGLGLVGTMVARRKSKIAA